MRLPLLPIVLVATSLACGPSTPPARSAPEPVAEVEAEDEPSPPEEIPLEEDPAPEGGAECTESESCGEEAACRGPAGCESPWACGPPRSCGLSSVAYCGCDGLTFYEREGCPGRPYAHVGPCEELGERLESHDEPTAGNAVCRSNADCRRGFVCAGLEGCTTFWTCVRRRTQRCTRERATFCSCEGETFEAQARCPGQPYAHRGACGDEGPDDALALAAGEASSAPSSRPEPRPSARPTVAPEPAAAPPEPTTCRRNADCSRGEICQVEEGCDGTFTCARPRERCVADTQYFCGCDGASFRASMNCPGRPFRHRGSCPR